MILAAFAALTLAPPPTVPPKPAPADPQAHVLELVQAGKCGEAHDAAAAANLESLADQITQMCGYKPAGVDAAKSKGRRGGGGARRGGGGGDTGGGHAAGG